MTALPPPWDQPDPPCVACGRDVAVVQGDRGPVKGPLERVRVGHFTFCADCLSASERRVVDEGSYRIESVVATTGPMRGHSWVVAVERVAP